MRLTDVDAMSRERLDYLRFRALQLGIGTEPPVTNAERQGARGPWRSTLDAIQWPMLFVWGRFGLIPMKWMRGRL